MATNTNPINPLSIPFPDFKYAEYINPEEFDANNTQIKTKVNELVTTVNVMKGAGTVLWTGESYPPGTTATPLTPTKKLSECNWGWAIIWSDYDPGVGANDFDFFTSVVPKYYGTVFNGSSHLFSIPRSLSSTTLTTTGKRLYIYDDKILGHSDNGSTSSNSNDVVIRAIIEI